MATLIEPPKSRDRVKGVPAHRMGLSRPIGTDHQER